MILSIIERILNRGGWITSNEVRKPYSGSDHLLPFLILPKLPIFSFFPSRINILIHYMNQIIIKRVDFLQWKYSDRKNTKKSKNRYAKRKRSMPHFV